jgi:hypothetical protein
MIMVNRNCILIKQEEITNLQIEKNLLKSLNAVWASCQNVFGTDCIFQ